jgi:hypothetical protein
LDGQFHKAILNGRWPSYCAPRHGPGRSRKGPLRAP